ncbi:DUF7312 domain-containing protein [Halococcus qingdaonensis]|uniref:DUF7312 domain-containing protein n=1 Tax=Halococcus qingdaonensis TaxID=224402 RepID=UPI0021169BE4|nr:hypothetical protein [Halococcus qingdaonensis]
MADDWKYAVEDLEDDGDESADDARATDVFGDDEPGDLEPGSPSFENVVFVLLGVAIALVVVLGI